jgi:Flp pilus assembly protein TadB
MELILGLALAVMCGLVILFFFLGVGRTVTKRDQSEQFHEMIDSITRSEIELDRQDANLPDPKTWSGYWYGLSLRAGSKFDNVATPGILAMGLPLFFFGVGFLVWPGGLIGGVLGAGVGLFGLNTFFKTKIKARIVLMEKQLPNLLSGIRANLQAHLTPQQAIINQAKEVPAPLGDELRVLVEEMAVGVKLDTALSNFGQRIPSADIRFLVSAIRTAIASGADLDGLVEKIQGIVVQRQRIANHLASAVAGVQPAIWVTGIMIPAAYFWSLTSTPENRVFWTSFPIGIIATGVVAFAYALGLFIAKKQVDRVRNS